ncbi:hypothetical protein [Nocardia sp. NPDC050413]|uniref:hypothetical protein n=1 Tax=Nocardia sp. NPDC050413 TaxID=3155784 RepID=UPI0033DB7925
MRKGTEKFRADTSTRCLSEPNSIATVIPQSHTEPGVHPDIQRSSREFVELHNPDDTDAVGAIAVQFCETIPISKEKLMSAAVGDLIDSILKIIGSII